VPYFSSQKVVSVPYQDGREAELGDFAQQDGWVYDQRCNSALYKLTHGKNQQRTLASAELIALRW
ncbi:hypothetical protein SB781_37890, partial [Paraburkholderia sp. SIMBA_061]